MNEYSVITKKRREKLCKATSTGEAIAKISKIAFGDQGYDESSGTPKTPDDTQTNLNHQLGSFNIDGVTYPTTTTARYSVTIPKDAMTGASVSEAALIDSDGDVVAIKNMYPKRKDSDVIFVFEFDDEF